MERGLGFTLDDDVVTCGEQECGNADGVSVLHNTSRNPSNVEQRSDVDTAVDEWIVFVCPGLIGIASEVTAFYETADRGLRTDAVKQGEELPSERNVEVDLEGGCGKDERAKRRREVLDPGGGGNGAQAMRHDGNFVELEVVVAGHVVDEAIDERGLFSKGDLARGRRVPSDDDGARFAQDDGLCELA